MELKMVNLLLMIFLISQISEADVLKVAVLDTGFDFKSTWSDLSFVKPKMCKYGHKDFTNTGIQDTHGHGTNVVGLMGKVNKDSSYCIVVVKVWGGGPAMLNTWLALSYAINLKVDIINYSGGGVEKDEKECNLIKKALDKGIVVVASAGNESKNLDESPFYPAKCDDRVMMISNMNINNRTLGSKSNISKDIIAVQGTAEDSLGLNNTIYSMSGTSQAAGNFTGKLIKLLNTRSNKHDK